MGCWRRRGLHVGPVVKYRSSMKSLESTKQAPLGYINMSAVEDGWWRGLDEQTELDRTGEPGEGAAALEAESSVQLLAARTSELGADVAKMSAKARETDPDKQVPPIFSPLHRRHWGTASCRSTPRDWATRPLTLQSKQTA